MAERKEDSVLMSLRELQRIEKERVRAEQEDERQKLDFERRTREDVDRKAREESERKAREGEEARRRAADEQARQEREERLRLEEAERKARIEAHMHLETERMRIDAHAKASQKKHIPWVPIGAALGVLVLIAGALGVMFVKKQRESASEQQALHAQLDREKREREEMETRMAESDRKLRELNDKLQQVTTDAERAELQEKIRQQAAEREKLGEAMRGRPSSPKPKSGGAKPKGPACDPNDPLCGIETK
ncbi:MAG: hypothetical protein AABZ30_08410 [Myxococcota bacterium]